MLVLTTPRLTLRQLTFDDHEPLHAILSDPVAMRFYPAPYTRDGTREWIQRNLDRYRDLGFGLLAVIRKEDGLFLGDCGLTIQSVDGEAEEEIGYHIGRQFWGQGYASEAAAAVRDWQFEVRQKRRVISWMSPENLASRRVAEKLGMRFEKWSNNRFDGPMVVYALNR